MPDSRTVSEDRGYVAVVRDVVRLVRREQIVLTSGSIAYFSFLSLVPLLLLLAVFLSSLWRNALVVVAVSRATRVLAPGNAAHVQEIVFGTREGDPLTFVTLAVLLWGALLTFRALNTTFAGIYGTYDERTLRDTVIDVVLVFGVIVFTVTAVTSIGVVLSTFVRDGTWIRLEPLVLFVVLAGTVLPLDYILPDVDTGVAEAAPGALFAAGAWVVLRTLFGYYVSVSVAARFYGAVSAFLLILVWLYVGGFVLMTGAALNAVLAGRVDPAPE
jgi:membrane protein